MKNCQKKSFVLSKENYIGDSFLFGAIVLLIGSVVRMGASIYLPAMPMIGKEFGINSAMMSNTLSIYFIVFSFFIIISGIFSDSYGRKPVLLSGMFFFMIGSLVCGFSQDYTSLMVGRAIQAFGASMIPGTLVAMVRDSCSDMRVVSLLGYLGVLGGLFLVTSPMIGGVLTHFISWRANFWFLILFTFLVFIVSIFKISETHTEATKTLQNIKSVFLSISKMLTSSEFMLVLLPVIIFFMVQGVFLSLAPYIVMNKYGLSPVLFGASNIFIMIGLFSGRMIGTKLLKKHDGIYIYKLSGYGSLFISLFFISLSFEESFGMWSFFIVNGLFSTLLGLVSPIGLKSSVSAFRQNSGMAASLQGAFSLGGVAFGSMVVSIVIKQFPEIQLQSVFGYVSALFCLLATIMLFISKPDK